MKYKLESANLSERKWRLLQETNARSIVQTAKACGWNIPILNKYVLKMGKYLRLSKANFVGNVKQNGPIAVKYNMCWNRL